jgi:hypothetical protein
MITADSEEKVLRRVQGDLDDLKEHTLNALRNQVDEFARSRYPKQAS